jgi:uncharacterized protein (DUF111 family)
MPPASDPELETICQLETTVDDMSPQLWEPVIETLLEAGALDVYLTPVIMKRNRPRVVLTALCGPARVPELARTLLEASTTIGVRWTRYQRRRLPREIVTLSTPHGAISFKVSRLDGRVVTVTPEEVRRIAREKGLPLRESSTGRAPRAAGCSTGTGRLCAKDRVAGTLPRHRRVTQLEGRMSHEGPQARPDPG